MLMTRIITWQDVQSEKGAWDILVWLGEQNVQSLLLF